jgi:hypothetical protein
MMTDAAGALVWQARYEPFGAVAELSGPAAPNMRFSRMPVAVTG